MVFNNEINSFPKMSVKQPLACNWSVLFTSANVNATSRHFYHFDVIKFLFPICCSEAILSNDTFYLFLQVQEGVDALLFQLLVLGCLVHSSGHVWRKSELDYYIIENMPLLARDSDMQVCVYFIFSHNILNVVIFC